MDDEAFNTHLLEWHAMPRDIRGPSAYYVSPYPNLLDAKLEVFCALYLQADESQRVLLPQIYARDEPMDAFAKVADWIASRQHARNDLDNLIEYMRRVSKTIKFVHDAPQLRLGLAAAAILEERSDYRDVIVSLATLHRAATQARIDPASYFEEVAALARPETGQFIRDFLKRDEGDITQMVDFAIQDDKELSMVRSPATVDC